MSKVQVDKVVNLSDDGAPQLTYGAELPVGYGLTGAGGLNITGVVTAASAVFSGNVTIGGTLTYEDVTNIDSVGIVTARAGVNVSGGQLLVGSGVTIGIAGVSTFSGTSDIHLLDNVRLNVGDGSDLAIYHDNSHSYLEETGTGALKLKGDDIRLENSSGNNIIKANTNVAELFNNGNKKWETTNDGTVTTGIGTFTSHVSLPDSAALCLGSRVSGTTLGDLRLYHNGSHSYIDEIGVGNLYIRNGSKNSIWCQTDGQVKLYHNDSAKFETTNDGTVTTGIATVTNLHSGSIDCTGELNFTGNGDKFIDVATLNGSNTLTIRHQDGGSYETAATFTANGAAALQYNGGTKLVTTDVGVNLKSGASNTTKVIIGNTANRGLEITTYNNAGNNDSGVVFNAADTTTSGYHATLEFDLGGVEFGRFDGNYDAFRLASACNGITFNGDYAAANRLKDYEEGTFTATMANSVTLHGSTTLCYVKVGKIVMVHGELRVNDSNSGSDFAITNMPFTSDNPGNGSGYSVGSVSLYEQNMNSGFTQVVCKMSPNTTTLTVMCLKESGNNSPTLDATNNGYIAVDITYRAA